MHKPILSFILFLSFFYVSSQEVQWSTKLLDFSSEWRKGLAENSSSFRATQVLGYPNTMVYGTSPLAWAPAAMQSGKEYVVVGFEKLQYVQQVIIGENYNAGAVKEIILYDDKDKAHTVYENKNTYPKDNHGQVLISYKISPTTFKTQKLKLILNTDKVGGMQQIDCIGISSSTQPVLLKINEILYKDAIAQPENLGPNINSEFYDHLPILSPDEQLIYFARKWADNNTGTQQKDDIYFAYQLQNGTFTKAQNIGSPLNTEEHNFVVFVSKDNNRLYLANRYKKGDMTGISISSKDKYGKWQKPIPLIIPDLYNNNEYAHYHLNLNEDVLLMCVDKLDGLGDLDIFVSFKYADGTWTKPKNLGKTINTVSAEGSVFLAADNKTLFFSSAGHQGYGSYDMYVSKRLDDTWTNWSTPLNLGTKINTSDLDIYYTITSSGEYAYFSSGKTYFGKNDLYRIKLPKEIQPEPVVVNNPQILANSIQKSTPSNTVYTTQQQQNTLPPSTNNSSQLSANNNSSFNNYQKKIDSLNNLKNNITLSHLTKVESNGVQQKPVSDNLKNQPTNNVQYNVNTSTLPTTNSSSSSAPTSTNIKPQQDIPSDPYAEKLAQLKNKQNESKLQQNTTPNTSQYNSYTEKKDYTNPTIDKSNNTQPTKNSMEQKLQELNTNVYQESKRLENNNENKVYENNKLKEKQTDTYEQQYNETQNKIAQLKQQQLQSQTTSTPAPKKSEIKPDYSNPNTKYVPNEITPQTTTEIQQNPQVQKYQEKLKAIQDKMNSIDNYNPNASNQPTSTSQTNMPTSVSQEPIAQKIQDLNYKTEAVVSKTDDVLNTYPEESKPDKTDYKETINQQPKEEELSKQLAEIAKLKSEQEQLHQQLNNTLNNLNNNKQNLEKDIVELTNERNKVNQQLITSLNNLNQDKNTLEKDIDNLSAEKKKLEQDKKAMDDLLAQMQAEKDKIAAEKAKLDKDKQLLETLKKQQEKEVLALSKNIDSLQKLQQKAIDANAQIQRYEIFDVPIEEGAIAIMKSIYFMADASFLQNKSFPELDKLVAFLKQNTKIQKIEIGGHTNGLCDDVFCNKLSNDRAKSVMDYLIKNGIPADKLTYKGYGKQYLISKPGDPVNQRVEVKIISVK